MKHSRGTTLSVLLVLILSVGSVAQKGAAQKSKPLGPSQAALDVVTAEGVMSHIKVLASDQFEGRGPGTPGEDLTIKYIADQFKAVGLSPGNTDGTYFQKVPVAGIATQQDAVMNVKASGKDMTLRSREDFVARSVRVVEKTGFDADVVFVGYGVVAPEYGWDDYKGVDVRGKVVLMLVNDPAVPDPKNPAKLDTRMFKGRAMTYYGRWTYKYEIAAEKGAAGVFVIHEWDNKTNSGPAGYPWEVARGMMTSENFDLVAKDNNMSRVNVEGWITDTKTKEIFNAAGLNFAAMKKAATRKDFKPVDLKAHAKLDLSQKVRFINSNNVVGKLEGADPRLKDEYVIYTAHWDHLGVGIPNEKGDKIYNGALDNATGCSGMIEMARAFKSLPTPPRRSILFLSVTAEEKGLIGSRYYAENPIYPLEKTAASINMDGLNQWGPTRDFTVVGLGNSTLDDVLQKAAPRRNECCGPIRSRRRDSTIGPITSTLQKSECRRLTPMMESTSSANRRAGAKRSGINIPSMTTTSLPTRLSRTGICRGRPRTCGC